MAYPHALESLVGITGDAASGKDHVARLFEQYGFRHISSSDLVREEIYRLGLTPSRVLQTTVANQLRELHGAGYWVDRSLERADAEDRRVVISGLYSPGEGKHLIEAHGGFLVALVAQEDDVEMRYSRLQRRADGSRDEIDIEEFRRAYQRENSGTALHETNIAVLASMATFTINHCGGLELLEDQTRAVIEELTGSQV